MYRNPGLARVAYSQYIKGIYKRISKTRGFGTELYFALFPSCLLYTYHSVLASTLFLNCWMNWIHYKMLCNFICETRSWSLSNFRSSTKFFRPSIHISWYWSIKYIMYMLHWIYVHWPEKSISYTGDPTFKLRTSKSCVISWECIIKEDIRVSYCPRKKLDLFGFISTLLILKK